MTGKPTANDSKLMWRIAQGDESAMRTLFDHYYPKLCFYAASFTGNEEDARDIAQNALLQCWNNRTIFETQQEEQAGAWLYTVVRRDCYDFLKHQKVRENKQQQMADLVPLTGEGADAGMIYTEVIGMIYREIAQLPPQLASIVTLSFIEGLSTSDIADQLKLTSNHVRVLRSRALEKLRNALLKQHVSAPAVLAIFFSEIFRTRL